ncbi:CTP synthase C-terminal region-related (seleno)protein [Actinoplanes sp. HUAS TT8]|uniref:CTP synthase C-terminal region-related (seleno)protein n=1 Tax=Actinoplanes sp. HUAS TT8 TaxID=3447453 RepID=UPI003F5237D7
MISIALVGDRSPTVRAHGRIPMIVDALRESEGLDLDVYWVPTPAAEDPEALRGFSGIWLVPGSPYRSEAGAVGAVRIARTEGIPFLGTCGGFQHAMLDFARDVCGFTGARHAENGPAGEDDLIVELSCSLAGHEAAVDLVPGSLVERLLGATRTVERYHCSYGLSPAYLELLQAHGMRFTGHDRSGEVRVAELPGHPFFLASLFQPELSGEGAHPLIRGFARAAGATSRPVLSGPAGPNA